jgi:hypothetical protein
MLWRGRYNGARGFAELRYFGDGRQIAEFVVAGRPRRPSGFSQFRLSVVVFGVLSTAVRTQSQSATPESIDAFGVLEISCWWLSAVRRIKPG